MRDATAEALLLEFLSGRLGASALRRALRGRAPEPQALPDPALEPMPRHLLLLCDAVLARELDAALLGPIGAWLARSQPLQRPARDPDARVVREVLALWSRAASHEPFALEAVAVHRSWVVARRRPVGA